MFLAAREWYARVGEEDDELVAPMMIWDTLPHGGASQIHPHLQVGFIVKIINYNKFTVNCLDLLWLKKITNVNRQQLTT